MFFMFLHLFIDKTNDIFYTAVAKAYYQELCYCLPDPQQIAEWSYWINAVKFYFFHHNTGKVM